MIPVAVKFDHASVDYQYEVEIDSDRKAVAARDKNGVVYVAVGSPTAYKPLQFLITEEAAVAMITVIADCLEAKPNRLAMWNTPLEAMKDAVVAALIAGKEKAP